MTMIEIEDHPNFGYGEFNLYLFETDEGVVGIILENKKIRSFVFYIFILYTFYLTDA